MALKKQATPKRWRSKEAKEIVATVQRAGGQVERTASGHLKVIGPTGSAIVASAPNTGRAGGRAVHNTLATIRSKTGLQVWAARPTEVPVVVVGARRAGMVAVVLAGLTMGLAFAHALELPQKLDYDPATWTQLQHSLYRYFAVVGGPLEVATIIAAVVFAVRAHRLRGGRLAVVGAVCFVLALGWWFAVVNTANAEVGRWAVDAVPSDWRRWRTQWEFGHAGHFVVTFAGFLALLGATVRVGAPDHRRVPGRS